MNLRHRQPKLLPQVPVGRKTQAASAKPEYALVVGFHEEEICLPKPAQKPTALQWFQTGKGRGVVALGQGIQRRRQLQRLI